MSEQKGNLLDCDAQVIVQQCNCITLTALGLSQAIKDKFGICPYAARKGIGNVANQETSAIPGTIEVIPIDSNRYCACLFAQYAPGTCAKLYAPYERAKQARGIQETAAIREEWFNKCLDLLAIAMVERGLNSVAFPHGIGCGLAGGKWQNYEAMIRQFAAKHNNFDVRIVQLQQ
jgi:O-acetyl-ADP-ribose deacetylase (regulator of RNase III)